MLNCQRWSEKMKSKKVAASELAAAGLAPMLIDQVKTASIVDVSLNHFLKLVEKGLMPKPINLDGAVRWDVDEVKLYLQRLRASRDSGASPVSGTSAADLL